ncbi:hypothetical protein LARI1_G008482 [Lachnellula arida]|uniref:ABM domain-containing protein n=1 Tax=Lachnellula arida TaxID=1316785 RepID=A0A8T9B0S7_9HELO|nr:hypothetical protein LARI1_G008482 [Lachnellula arida]
MAEPNITERKYIVASWTTLTIPISTTIEKAKTPYGKKWLSLMRPMRRQQQPDFFHGLWGRVVESPETVWFVTGWKSAESLSAFETSPTAATQFQRLAAISTSPPSTVHVNFTGFWWDRVTSFTGVMDAHFGPVLSPAVRLEIEDLRSLVYFSSPGQTEPKAMNGRGVRGFVQEEEGGEVIMRFIDFWNSEEKEEDFKKNAGVMLDGKSEGVWEHLLRGLGEKGMVKLMERHCAFEHFPTHFFGTEESDLALWE